MLLFYWLSMSGKVSVNIDMSWNEKVQTVGQLFWSEGSRMDQFGEDRSSRFEVLVGRKFYQIYIPSYINSLRIDPAIMPGSISIHRISIKYFGWTLKHWEDATGFLEWQNQHDLKTFKITESEWEMQSLSIDPYFADLSLRIALQVGLINACLSLTLTIFVALIFAFAQRFTPNFLAPTEGLSRWFNESIINFFKNQNYIFNAEKFFGIFIAVICTLFVAQLGEVLRTSQTPFVWADSWDYFFKSMSIYSNPSFQTVTSFDRPLFCWWIPLLASWFSVSMRLNELIFYNNLTSFLMFFCGLSLFCRNIKLSKAAVLWILCLVLIIPIESLLSQPHGLMGDFYLSGYILLAEGAL